jgi:hypothetical protein
MSHTHDPGNPVVKETGAYCNCEKSKLVAEDSVGVFSVKDGKPVAKRPYNRKGASNGN